jgi:hypothetical protein
VTVSVFGRPTLTPPNCSRGKKRDTFAVDDDAQLPFHQVGRDALGLVHARRIECRKLGQSLLREGGASEPELGRLRRQLLFELLLLGAREVSRRCGLAWTRPDPLGREVSKEVGHRARARHRLLGGDAERASEQDDNRESFHDSTWRDFTCLASMA